METTLTNFHDFATFFIWLESSPTTPKVLYNFTSLAERMELRAGDQAAPCAELHGRGEARQRLRAAGEAHVVLPDEEAAHLLCRKGSSAVFGLYSGDRIEFRSC